MACGLSRLDFDLPSALSVWGLSAIISQKVIRVNHFPSGGEKFFRLEKSVWYYTRFFGVLSSKKAAAGKNFFVKHFLKNFLNFFRSYRIGWGLSSIFCIKQQESAFKKKKKKNSSHYIIPYLIRLVKHFLQKTFFIFREIFVDFRAWVCYNICVR